MPGQLTGDAVCKLYEGRTNLEKCGVVQAESRNGSLHKLNPRNGGRAQVCELGLLRNLSTLTSLP